MLGKCDCRLSLALVTRADVRRHRDTSEMKELDWLAAVTAIASTRHNDGFILSSAIDHYNLLRLS